jgi:3-methyladenine DNA glycosylase/8-oxoguanine DNA glycosylase
MFDLDADTTAIGKHLGSDPFLHPLVRRHPGLRVPGAWEPFEMAVRAVLGESMAEAAGSDLGDLVRRLGPQRRPRSAPAGRRPSRIFPSAETVLHARRDDLPPGHARTIQSLAQTALSGADEESLLRVPGVGESTSQYVALRAFRRPDAFPADDPTLHDVAGASERWRPWRAYAAMHVWRASVPRD